VTSTLVCRRTLSLGAGTVYAWESAEGATGGVLVDREGAVARPCTPEGVLVGDMLLRRSAGDVEQPDPDQEARRAFLLAASVIFQEWQRQGRPPETVTRTYW
jgi:hypothetical protein